MATRCAAGRSRARLVCEIRRRRQGQQGRREPHRQLACFPKKVAAILKK